MNTAAKVRMHKQTWPEMYCPNRTCLWRVKHDGRPDTPCPKHMGYPQLPLPLNAEKCATCNGRGVLAHGDACDDCGKRGFTFPPECCQSCGAPFNNANPSPSGKCPACEA